MSTPPLCADKLDLTAVQLYRYGIVTFGSLRHSHPWIVHSAMETGPLCCSVMVGGVRPGSGVITSVPMLRLGVAYAGVCDYLGISRTTLYRYLKPDGTPRKTAS